MKIVQLNAVYGISSTGRLCKDISDCINSNGCDQVFTFFNEGEEDSHSFKFGLKFDRKAHAFFSRLTGLQGYFSKRETKKLIKKIKNIKPDAIILHNIHCNSFNFKLLFNYFAKNRTPVFLYLHDCFFFTGRCTHFTNANCLKWKKECINCPLLHLDNNSWFFDTSNKTFKNKANLYMNNNINVIGVSNWITECSKESTLLAKFPHKRIYNWIDFNVFKPHDVSQSVCDKLQMFNNKKIILSVSSKWSDAKGLNTFIQLSEMLSDEYQIVLVGNYTGAKDNNIYFYGPVNSIEELSSLYNRADIYLNLSKQETFGLVSAEALSCGTPVICYNLTANSELVNDKCGRVIDYKNSSLNELKSIIEDICSKGKAFYTDACIENVMNKFDKETNISELLSFVKERVNNEQI